MLFVCDLEYRFIEESGKHPGLSGKAKYFLWSIVNKYREGKVKSIPEGRWNSTWNHIPTRSRSRIYPVTACLLKNEPTSLFYVASHNWPPCQACRVKARVNSPCQLFCWNSDVSCFNRIIDQSHGQDPKPSDLTMARLKWYESIMEDRTHAPCNMRGWVVVSGEIPIELGDSWFSSK